MNSIEQYIIDLYKSGLSPYEIAEKIPNYNHMKIRRMLTKLGIPQRGKSEGQRTALASGRSKHPKQKVVECNETTYNTEEIQTKSEEKNDE